VGNRWENSQGGKSTGLNVKHFGVDGSGIGHHNAEATKGHRLPKINPTQTDIRLAKAIRRIMRRTHKRRFKV
jgi:hypothetical protein